MREIMGAYRLDNSEARRMKSAFGVDWKRMLARQKGLNPSQIRSRNDPVINRPSFPPPVKYTNPGAGQHSEKRGSVMNALEKYAVRKKLTKKLSKMVYGRKPGVISPESLAGMMLGAGVGGRLGVVKDRRILGALKAENAAKTKKLSPGLESLRSYPWGESQVLKGDTGILGGDFPEWIKRDPRILGRSHLPGPKTTGTAGHGAGGATLGGLLGLIAGSGARRARYLRKRKRINRRLQAGGGLAAVVSALQQREENSQKGK